MPQQNIRVVGDRVLGLEFSPARPRPHHVSYLDGEGTLYAGDAAGVRIQPSEFVSRRPAAEFDRDAWHRTLDEIERRAPERLALIHFGVADDVSRHLAELRERLDIWSAPGQGRRGTRTSSSPRRSATSRPTRPTSTTRAMPFWQSYQG